MFGGMVAAHMKARGRACSNSGAGAKVMAARAHACAAHRCAPCQAHTPSFINPSYTSTSPHLSHLHPAAYGCRGGLHVEGLVVLRLARAAHRDRALLLVLRAMMRRHCRDCDSFRGSEFGNNEEMVARVRVCAKWGGAFAAAVCARDPGLPPRALQPPQPPLWPPCPPTLILNYHCLLIVHTLVTWITKNS